MNFLGFGQSADIDIVFDGGDNRKLAEVKTEDGKKEKYLLYYDGETVSGRVNVTLKKPGSKLEHHGIKIELIGQIELYYDRGNHHEFTALVRELARPGDLIQNTGYPFEFANVEKPYEVYVGSNVRLRYFLRVTIVRRLSDIVKEVDIAVHTLCSYPDANSPIKMEVGIEDCLHIEFEYNKSKYHLKDVIVGKIYFLLVRIKIKHMEIAIIKRETTGSGSNTFTENETIAKYEIMDGAPVKGESIPIRVFLAGYDLTPTMRDINKKFSVRYFLNLVLMDTEDRRYFKQQEITLWRKADKGRKSTAGNSSTNIHMPSHLVGFDGEIMNKQQGAIQNDIDTGIDDSGERQLIDPTMGLFTQESPKQEANKPLLRESSEQSLNDEDDDGTGILSQPKQQQPRIRNVPETNSNQLIDELNVEAERGAGDGASSHPNEGMIEGGGNHEEDSSAGSNQLFNSEIIPTPPTNDANASNINKNINTSSPATAGGASATSETTLPLATTTTTTIETPTTISATTLPESVTKQTDDVVASPLMTAPQLSTSD